MAVQSAQAALGGLAASMVNKSDELQQHEARMALASCPSAKGKLSTATEA